MSKDIYNYIIVGAGIAGCSVAHFLSKEDKNILLLDKNEDVAFGASGAAGAFLSPLLGKPNKFKDLVTKSLKFSTTFYKENLENEITSCGVVRIPKDKEDREKFESYKPFMDFSYKTEDDGFFFDIGSQVNSYEVCKYLSKDTEKKFNYEVKTLELIEGVWHLNKELKAKNIILCTGANIELIKEKYFNIRAVWGQKIDVLTSTKINKNYHKACSLSKSKATLKNDIYKVSIGATHHRQKDIVFTKELIEQNNEELLLKAQDIKKLEDIEVYDVKYGARASSVDYFPMLGSLVDSSKTLEEYPHFVNGTFVKDEMLSFHDNLYVLNGVGGRGFVLSPYLAKCLVDFITKKEDFDEEIKTNRLFKRWVKKLRIKK